MLLEGALESKMPNESARCQFIDLETHMECDRWYPYEDGQKFCEFHRPDYKPSETEVKRISRTVTVFSNDHVTKMNEEIQRCLQMTIPEIADHIKGIEEKIKELERDRRAANIAKRNLEDRLTDEERAALRESTNGYKGVERQPKIRKSPEEKAKNRKEGFSAWAARLGMKVEDLMVMDDDDLSSRIAKYKAAKG